MHSLLHPRLLTGLLDWDWGRWPVQALEAALATVNLQNDKVKKYV